LYYGSADQTNAKATSLVYSTATPGGANALSPSVALAKSTNPDPKISTFLTPLYDVSINPITPVAYLSYLQNLSTLGTVTVSTNNYSVYNLDPSSNYGTIQFTIIANKTPFATNFDYTTTPISKNGKYSTVNSIIVNVNSDGLRTYTFSTNPPPS